MLQRLGLAACLVGDPALLILDEPCSALDPAGRREVLDLIGRLARDATVVLSTHILADVQQVCDTVAVVARGRIGSDLMTLWHLELVRLTRTYRWTIVFGTYGRFGVIGPVTGRYLGEMSSRRSRPRSRSLPAPSRRGH